MNFAPLVMSSFFRREMHSFYRITPVFLQTESQRKEKLQRSVKLMFIFLEASIDSFVTAAESASQSSPRTRANLHQVEAAEEGLLLGESAEYTASQAHRPTQVPTTHPSIPPPATRAKLRFHQRSSSSRLTGSTTSSPEEDDDASALDSWIGLPNLSIDVGVDRHRRTEEVGRNYSSATLSLPHRRRRQENQAADEPCSTGKT
jgi:hypothetical protein